jgi:hypothetical protein
MQPNTFLEGDEVVLKEYPLTAAGAIESFIISKYDYKNSSVNPLIDFLSEIRSERD